MDVSDAKKELEQEDVDYFEDVINKYLRVLDHQQHEIYAVRMMHHEVWRDVHQVPGVSETRAGSRVERYTKILPTGARSDVDYKLCVNGLEIDWTRDDSIYLKPCSNKAYCKFFLTDQGLKRLEENGLHWQLFDNSIRKCKNNGGYVVVPAVFKTNVVQHSQFEMKETKEPVSTTSPAVSGEGALNPYDLVPCLKVKVWPTFLRRKVIDMYGFQSTSGERLPMFIVPTGNPFSQDRDLEWRLSFAVFETDIFRQLQSHQRRLYGLAKYVFKVTVEEIDLIQSYHVKVLFLLKLEEDDLSESSPLAFLTDFFKYMHTAVNNQYIPHLFVEDCNIYPFHHHTDEKKERFGARLQHSVFKQMVTNKVKEIISHDVGVSAATWKDWLRTSKAELEKRQKAGLSEVWVAGYLTRLLSVIMYCLRKSHVQGKLGEAVNNLVKLVEANSNDAYIHRVVPYIKYMLGDAFNSKHAKY